MRFVITRVIRTFARDYGQRVTQPSPSSGERPLEELLATHYLSPDPSRAAILGGILRTQPASRRAEERQQLTQGLPNRTRPADGMLKPTTILAAGVLSLACAAPAHAYDCTMDLSKIQDATATWQNLLKNGPTSDYSLHPESGVALMRTETQRANRNGYIDTVKVCVEGGGGCLSVERTITLFGDDKVCVTVTGTSRSPM